MSNSRFTGRANEQRIEVGLHEGIQFGRQVDFAESVELFLHSPVKRNFIDINCGLKI